MWAKVKFKTIAQAAGATETSSVGRLGVEGVHLDTADTLTLNGGNLDVAGLAPRSTPGVSDNVVVLASLSTVANGSDGVIELGTAGDVIEDTTLVHLEGHLISLNGDGDGGESDGSLKLGNGVGLDVRVGSNLDLLEGLGGRAGTGGASAGGIRVLGLKLCRVSLKIREGMGLPATVATLGSVIARDNLLLGKGEELTGLDEVGTLKSADGGESPAGTALGLVLGSVNGTLGSPVDGIGELGVIEDDNVLGGVVVALEAEELLVLLMSPGGHVVVGDGEGVLSGVDLLDLGILDGVLLKSELVLLGGTVHDTELVEMGLEVLLNVVELMVLLALFGLDASVSGGLAEELHFLGC